MFREALESILRVSPRVSSCVCYQAPLTLFIWYRALFHSVSHWALHQHTHTHTHKLHKLRWEAQSEVYCHTNKHIHSQDPEKVQWESRCQFSHEALMGARRVNMQQFSFFRACGVGSSRSFRSPVDPEPLHLRGEAGKCRSQFSHWLNTQQKLHFTAYHAYRTLKLHRDCR